MLSKIYKVYESTNALMNIDDQLMSIHLAPTSTHSDSLTTLQTGYYLNLMNIFSANDGGLVRIQKT